MFESIPTFLNSLRQTRPVIFLGIAIATCIILFIPTDFAATLGMDSIRENHRSYLRFAFIGSISILLVNGVWGGIKYGKKFRKHRKTIKMREQYLHDLTADEKAYLFPYIIEDENTQYFLIEDGIAGGLERKKIIYRSSDAGNILRGWAYNIQPWAKEYLTISPFLLEGASLTPNAPPRW